MILLIAFGAFVQRVLIIETQLVPVKLSGANLSAENILPYAISYSHGGMAPELWRV
jgi:hypothetical protein